MLPVIFFFVTLLVNSQALSGRQRSDIDVVVQNIMRCARIPAASLSFRSYKPPSKHSRQEEEVVYSQAYGTVDRTSGQQTTTQHAFCIGGGTQAFTAVLLAKLISMNENVTWDTPVQEILNTRVVMKEAYLGDHLTLKDIFAMRSGVSPMDIVPWVKPYDVDGLISHLRYAPLSAGYREKYVKSEILFSLVIKVAEELGQDNWYNLIRRHIFQPLKMTQSTFIGTQNVVGGVQLARGNVYYNGQPTGLTDSTYNGMDLIAPAASICTSAEDFSRWFQLLLKNGRSLSNTLVIRENDLEMLYQPIVPRGNGDPTVKGFSEPAIPVGYKRDQNALGFITGQYRGSFFVSQDGSLPGYQSLATYIPDKKIAAYVAFNSDERPKSFAAKVLINQLGLDMLTTGKTWLNEYDVCDIMDDMAAQFENEMDEAERRIVRTGRRGLRSLEEYEGSYRSFGFGDLMVKVENKSESTVNLVMQYGTGKYVLEDTNVNDTFQLRATSGDLWFSTNADLYREINKMYATFSFDPRDEEERINKVTISGFNDQDVEFSVNPREPEYDIGRARQTDCNSQGSVAPSSASLAASLLIMLVTTFFRR